MNESYAKAGVNINAADKVNKLIGKHAHSTFRPEVLSRLGSFGGLFEMKGYQQPVLVSSVDGVGTKLKIADALDNHDTIGIDIVNHCINDIFTCGAEPLFFLDYIAMGRLVPEKVEAIIKGIAQACQEVNCALIGGETAEMPGIYSGEDFDLAGFIIGVVEKENIITGKDITEGDTIIGLPSNGLHTNGYSLVRKIFEMKKLPNYYLELKRTLGETLLEPHLCYYNQLKPLLQSIKGIAHITGGGLIGNVPRILPEGIAAQFQKQSWTVPPIFHLIQQQGNVDEQEMYRVFNMGIGITVICSPDNVNQFTNNLPDAKIIGNVIKQTDESKVIID
ncbi:phosphoribosylformylglycinamidine cyclo-ligase [Chloroflexota bacterium]